MKHIEMLNRHGTLEQRFRLAWNAARMGNPAAQAWLRSASGIACAWALGLIEFPEKDQYENPTRWGQENQRVIQRQLDDLEQKLERILAR
jgi:hypothetical protein